MKRLIFSPAFPPSIGGCQNFIYSRCRVTPKEIEVIASTFPESNKFDKSQDFTIHRFNYPWHIPKCELSRRLLQMYHTARILRHHFNLNRYNAVEVSTVFPGALVAQILLPRKDFFLVSYALGDDILRPLNNRYIGLIFKYFLRKIDLFVTISRYTKNLLINAGVSPDRIIIIHPSIDQERFSLQGEGDSIKKNLPPHDLIILTVSRLVEKKGIDRIIELMPKLKKQFPGLLYVVGGEGVDLRRLQRLVRKFEVTDSVIFLGRITPDKLVNVYAAGDVFVMPTRTDYRTGSIEGFGIVFLEAGSQELPVIGPRGSGSEDVIIDGVTGYLVNPYDLEEIESRIVDLLNDPNLRQRFGEAGKKRAFQPTNWSPLLNLKQICKSNPNRPSHYT